MSSGPPRTIKDKFFEKVPPLAGIFLIVLPIILSFIAPIFAAYYVLALNVYFLYKSIAFAVQFALSLIKIRETQQINWDEKLEGLEDIPTEIFKIENQLKKIKKLKWSEVKENRDMPQNLSYPDQILFNVSKLPQIFQRLLFHYEKWKTINYLEEENFTLNELLGREESIHPSEIQHVVMIPHAKEPYSILRETLRLLKKQTFSNKQINIVLGAEAADPDGVKKSRRLKNEFKDDFNNIWITNHVLGKNEIVGKSSNMAWAGKAAVKEIKKLGWDLKKVTMTSCDADSKLPETYFSYVTYLFLTQQDAKYKFFNGAMVFYNNIWRLPFYARIKNSMSTIYNVSRLVRTDKLFPFSTYTTSFWLIEQIGYWTPWVTPEDYHLFFKSLFKFPDKVSCIPMYTKIMSDAAEGKTHWATIKNNYKQERRWSWGVSDDGWVIQSLIKNWNKYNLRVKYMTFHVLFDHVIGVSGSAIILVGGNLLKYINPVFDKSVLGVRLPGVSSTLIRFTLIFMVIVILLDFYLKPRPKHNPWWRKITRIVEWVALPYASFILSLLPGIEAHTRLLFGRYLEYYVTKKIGKDEAKSS